MKRLVFKDLKEWKTSKNRKSLILKGARQVGKTYLIRKLGETFEQYYEINFEERDGFIKYAKKSQLYYWVREEKGSSSEVDYLIEKDGFICPIEVKSGSQGTLKSLNRFLFEKSSTKFGLHLSKREYKKNRYYYIISNLFRFGFKKRI